MLSVIIAEDEPYIRRSLQKLIDWESLGCHVTGGYESGEEVLEALKDKKADILITDIVMDGMSGLELTEEAARLSPSMQIIILTGYADFDYARTALKLQVTDFILKPTDPEDLKKAIQKAKECIEKEKKQKIYIDKLKKEIHMDLPRLIREFLEGVLYKTLTLKEMEARRDFLGLMDESYFLLAAEEDSITLYSDEDMEEARALIRKALFKKAASWPNDTMIPLFGGQRGLLFLYSGKDPEKAAMSLHRETKRLFRASFSFGISLNKRTYLELPEAKLEAEEALDARFFLGPGSLILYSDIARKKIGKSGFSWRIHEGLSRLDKALIKGDSTEADKTLSDLFSLLEESGHTGQGKNVLLEIVFMILKIGREREIPLEKELEINAFLAVQDSRLFSDFRETIRTLVQNVSEGIAHQIEQEQERVSTKIIEFIKSHYSEPLTLDEVGQAVYKSPKYICRLLKKDTGRTFSEILKSLRMEEAARILKEKDTPVQDIAFLVGYQDPHYFSRVFRSFFKTSPSEYRENEIRK